MTIDKLLEMGLIRYNDGEYMSEDIVLYLGIAFHEKLERLSKDYKEKGIITENELRILIKSDDFGGIWK